MKRHRRDDGFTLMELLIVVVVLGVIIVPLGNFLLGYFKNVTTTQQRMSDSHDVQIAAAYFSQDVANTGLHSTADPFPLIQSVWTSGFPGSYCGQGLGTTTLLLEWDAWTVGTTGSGQYTGTQKTSSAAYVTEGSTLHRIYCAAGTTQSSDATIVHNLQSASVSCNTACNGSTPPATVTLSLTISGGATDQAAPSQPVTLTGQRRQT
jgi:prepilin-type N-terminal cleavage/methylation domain-containing protein